MEDVSDACGNDSPTTAGTGGTAAGAPAHSAAQARPPQGQASASARNACAATAAGSKHPATQQSSSWPSGRMPHASTAPAADTSRGGNNRQAASQQRKPPSVQLQAGRWAAASLAPAHAKRTTSPAGLMGMRLLQALSALHSLARHRNQVCCKLSILSRRALCSTYNGSKLCSNYWMLSREAACCGRHVLGVSVVRCLWCRLVDLGHGLAGSKRGWPEPDAPAWLEPSDQTSSAMDPGAQRVVKVKAHKLAATSHPRPWILAPKRRC